MVMIMSLILIGIVLSFFSIHANCLHRAHVQNLGEGDTPVQDIFLRRAHVENLGKSDTSLTKIFSIVSKSENPFYTHTHTHF